MLCPEGDGEDLAPLGEDFGEGERPIVIEGDRGMRGYTSEMRGTGRAQG